MKELVQRLVRGQVGPHLQALALLLITVGVIVAGLTITGCDGCQTTKSVSQPTVARREKPGLSTRTWGGGDLFHHGIAASGRTSGPPYPANATLTWQPPQGATNISFWPQPDPGGPPYQWSNLAVDGQGETPEINVYYDWPPMKDQSSVDTFTVVQPDGQQSSQSVTSGSSPSGSSEGQSPAARISIPSARETTALADDYSLWQIDYWVWTEEITVTTDLCQQWASFAQQDTAFVAVRFPVYPPNLVYTEPYTLPVDLNGPTSPVLSLTGTGPTPVLTVPLEYEPGRFTFLENEMPAAPGEHWLALGAVTTPTVTCPTGLSIPGGSWHLGAHVYLDFGGVQDTFADRVLTFYYCYEGQSPPEPLVQASRAWDVDVSATSYQGWGITCLGPRPLLLEGTGTSEPPFSIESTHAASITPTETISFSHSLLNVAGVPVTLTLSISSQLSLPWGIYSDAAGLVPLAGPIRLEGQWPGFRRYFWLITTVPAETPSGAETLLITATDVTSPALSVWTSDLLWVGDWVAPPELLSSYQLYLPLLLRQFP